MRQKKSRRRATVRQAAAGQENLRQFNASRSGKPSLRPALRHGVHSLLATGTLPPGKEQLVQKVDAAIGAMVSDLGGESELTAQRRAILESQRMCLLVLALSNDYLRTEGLLNARGKPHPLLATVVSFANCLRLNALALGFERRAKTATLTLESYLRQSTKDSGEAAAPGDGKAQ